MATQEIKFIALSGYEVCCPKEKDGEYEVTRDRVAIARGTSLTACARG